MAKGGTKKVSINYNYIFIANINLLNKLFKYSEIKFVQAPKIEELKLDHI